MILYQEDDFIISKDDDGTIWFDTAHERIRIVYPELVSVALTKATRKRDQEPTFCSSEW